jgi:hypothetical protein
MAAAGCPAGQVELLPNIRALPATQISMLDASNMRFSATELEYGRRQAGARRAQSGNDPVTGQTKQPVDQRVYCSGGSFYDLPAGKAEYHAAHNHVHYTTTRTTSSSPPTRRIRRTRGKARRRPSASWTRPGQSAAQGASAGRGVQLVSDPGSFVQHARHVGRLGRHLRRQSAGQSAAVDGLAPGLYRLRHVFDPKNLLREKDETDNESCVLVEIGDGANGRYSRTVDCAARRRSDHHQHRAALGRERHVRQRDDHGHQPHA